MATDPISSSDTTAPAARLTAALDPALGAAAARVDLTPFPPGFTWGAATASYQIEGAAREGGRGPSIWDTFSHTPGRTDGGDTGDVACDHYHRWAEDVELMVGLGLDAYRLSIAWPRVQPGGSGELNPEGVDFYRTLLKALREKGIRPVVTLYHWDLPQELEDAGGWTNRETALRFADYARLMARELGEHVHTWTTLNEPWCTAYLGYAAGVHAPGRTDPAAAVTAAHHLNLAHGLAVAAIRDELGEEARCSVTLNLQVVYPADPASEADREAAACVERASNEIFLGPMLLGAYPPALMEQASGVTDWSFVHAGDLDISNARIDALGVNYYTTATVRARGEEPGAEVDNDAAGEFIPPVGTQGAVMVAREGARTDMGWLVEPRGLTDVLVELSERFPGLELQVTENGAAYPDQVSEDGVVHDEDRISYLVEHLNAVGAAITAGAPVSGYFVWSLLDNFEWAFGYAKRFGIVRVDYATGERTPKDSARVYREVLARSHRR